MQYIAAVSKSSSEVARVKDQLLESNPILEGLFQENPLIFSVWKRKNLAK
jgi:hypothetical protein